MKTRKLWNALEIIEALDAILDDKPDGHGGRGCCQECNEHIINDLIVVICAIAAKAPAPFPMP